MKTQRHPEKAPCDDGGRNWSDTGTSRAPPGRAGSHQELGARAGVHPPPEPLEGTGPAGSPMWASGLLSCKRSFCGFELPERRGPGIWGSSSLSLPVAYSGC